jgi:hypothetical protein
MGTVQTLEHNDLGIGTKEQKKTALLLSKNTPEISPN